MENKKTDFQSKMVEAEEEQASNTSSLLYRNEYKQILNCLDELKRANIKKFRKAIVCYESMKSLTSQLKVSMLRNSRKTNVYHLPSFN